MKIRVEETNAAVMKCGRCGTEIALVPLDPLYEKYADEYLGFSAPVLPEFQYWGRDLDQLIRVVCPMCRKTIADDWDSVKEDPVLRRLYTGAARTPVGDDECFSDEEKEEMAKKFLGIEDEGDE